MKKVKCPFCGYEMPILYDDKKSIAKGIFIRCKGRNCKKEFEININVK
jgi:transcription elongation factor Elf1